MLFRSTAPGTTVPLKFVRAKKLMTVNVTIEEFDAERQLAQQNEAEPPASSASASTDTGLDMSIAPVTPDVARQLDLPAGKTGVVIRDIDPTGVAARGGLRPGDLITSVNDVTTTTVAQVNATLERVPSGRLVRFQIFRGGRDVLVQFRKP